MRETRQDVLDIMSHYARIVSEGNPLGNRREVHRKLCERLEFTYDQFKPFEDSKIEKDLSWDEAMDILDKKISDFYYTRYLNLEELNKKPHLHCGCCQVLLSDVEEWKVHSRTKEHLRNAIKVIDKRIHDGHDWRFNQPIIEKLKKGEPVEYSMGVLYLEMKAEFIQRLHPTMSTVKVLDETLR
jgi:hypothetical protein